MNRKTRIPVYPVAGTIVRAVDLLSKSTARSCYFFMVRKSDTLPLSAIFRFVTPADTANRTYKITTHSVFF